LTDKKHPQYGKPFPELPDEIEHVWTWFTQIFNPGGVGMGPHKLPFAEIGWFARMTHAIIEPWEVLALRELSQAFVIVSSEKQRDVPSNATNLTTMQDNTGLRSLFMSQGSRKPAKTKRGPPKVATK